MSRRDLERTAGENFEAHLVGTNRKAIGKDLRYKMSDSLNRRASLIHIWLLAAFVVVVLGVGLTIGLMIRPGTWYASLQKPFITPPNWIFGPAWTIVYILIAVAGWRILITQGTRSTSFAVWILQMFLNWLWTPTFFGFHQIGIGLFVILLLLATSIVFTATARDGIAKWCFTPYIAWLCYASTLNVSILYLN